MINWQYVFPYNPHTERHRVSSAHEEMAWKPWKLEIRSDILGHIDFLSMQFTVAIVPSCIPLGLTSVGTYTN